MAGVNHMGFGSSSSSSLSISDSFASSFGSTDLTDDATSSSGSSSSFSTHSSDSGPLYQLSDLMSQLPIKRGLSKFYNGKSQTFGSLASVKSLEDLGKKETSSTSYNQRMKSCKSYGGNLNNQHKFGPKATIRKRSSPAPVTVNRTVSIQFKC